MWKPIILDVECIVCNKSLQKINHDPEEVSRKMGKIANRRSRTPNWSVDEKKYLLELIKERREVITRTTNGPNHYEEKDVAWNEILRELAKRFGNKFNGSSIKKVKTQWQNMKRIAREEIALNGPHIDKFSFQSSEVCNILELVKDGVLKTDAQNANLNETVAPNIEVKTERIDEDNQPCCSTKNSMEVDLLEQESTQTQNSTQNYMNNSECSSSISEQNSEAQEFEIQDQDKSKNNANVSNTSTSHMEDVTTNNLNPFYKKFQDFMRFTTAEKHIKMESLKEERQVIRAMRETAELNKIIAEQRLKHVLWVKKQEMS